VTATATAPPAVKTTAVKTAAVKATPVAAIPGVPKIKTPGPRLYRLMRIWLVVWTILQTALCIGSIMASQNQQEIAASSMIHAQDLRDLHSEVSYAQSLALCALLAPEDAGLWTSYENTSATIDSLLLASAASASDPQDMATIAQTLRTWQNQVTLAYYHAGTDGVTVPVAQTLDSDFGKLATAIEQASYSARSGQSANPFIVSGIIASVLGAFGFIIVMWVTARRSHRVLNLGLSVGLGAIIAAIVVVGVYAGQSSQITVVDSRIANLSEAVTSTWDARSLSAMTVLNPNSYPPYQQAVENLATLTRVNLQGAGVSLVGELNNVVATQTTIAETPDPDERAALVLTETTWQTLVKSINTYINLERPAQGSLVVNALWYTILLSLCALAAIIAALAGIHTRTKEYA